MANDKISIQLKKDLAKILFTREQLDQKIVAQRVGVSEKTMSKWVNDEGWKELRNRMLISREDQLNSFYEQLSNLNEQIKKNDFSVPDSKQADIQVKLTASIRSLETDLAIGDIVSAGMKFIKHIQKVGTIDQVKEFAELWNSFIQSEIKK
jgi:transposase